jgi:spermidine/putrescine transport system permease protein
MSSFPGTGTRLRRGTGERRRGAGIDVAMSPRGKWALIAFFVAFLIFLYLPTIMLAIFSFNTSSTIAFPLEGLTFDWYQRAFHNEELRRSLGRSLWVGGAVAGAATMLGVFVSYALARRSFRGKSLVSAFVLLPLVVPTVVLGVALLVLFRPDANVLPVPLGLLAVLIGHVVIALPFAVLLILPRIARIDRRLEEAAEDLGASWFQTFGRIVLPLITPAVISSILVCFVVSIDEVVIASFVAQPQSPTLPVYIYSGLRLGGTIPLLMPVATVMIIFSSLLVLASVVIRRVGERRLGLIQE